MRVGRLGSPGRPKSQRYPMQTMMEEFIAKQTKASRILAHLVAKELQKQGVTDVMERFEELHTLIERKMAASEDWDFSEFSIDDGTPVVRNYSVDLTNADLDSFTVNLEKGLTAGVAEMTEVLVEATLEAVREQADEALGKV